MILHTIVICTCNRMDEIHHTFQGLRNNLTRLSSTEIIVVNNGRASDTSVLEEDLNQTFQNTPVSVRVLYEARPGLSSARNRALEKAQGEIITMLDDDASPITPKWQETIIQTFQDKPQIGLCGGPSLLVVPEGKHESPWWRSPLTDAAMSCIDGPETGPCSTDHIFGLNASYRRSAIEGLYFNEQLGWNDSVPFPFAGEEMLFNQKVCRGGWQAWFDRDAAVTHRIQHSRYNAQWLLRRAYIAGRTAALFEYMIHGKRTSSTGKKVWKVIKSLIKLAVRAAQGKWPNAFSHICRIVDTAGYFSVSNTGKKYYKGEAL